MNSNFDPLITGSNLSEPTQLREDYFAAPQKTDSSLSGRLTKDPINDSNNIKTPMESVGEITDKLKKAIKNDESLNVQTQAKFIIEKGKIAKLDTELNDLGKKIDRLSNPFINFIATLFGKPQEYMQALMKKSQEKVEAQKEKARLENLLDIKPKQTDRTGS